MKYVQYMISWGKLQLMRRRLEKMHGERLSFIGVFEKTGSKAGFRGEALTTVLLREVRLKATNQIITDHLWFNMTKEFRNLCLQKGDKVEFDARVKDYVKGYFRFDVQSTDYKLSHPTKISKT